MNHGCRYQNLDQGDDQGGGPAISARIPAECKEKQVTESNTAH